MEITDEDWQRVVEAYERGRREEKFERDFPANNRKIAKELRRVKALLAKCSDDARFEIGCGLVGGQAALMEAINDGIISTTVNERRGRPKPWGYIEAVAVMRELRPGKKGPRYTVAGEQTAEEYIRWLGAHLKRLDPEHLRADEVAWTAAWNALKALDDERKPVPGTGAPSRG